MKQQKQTGITVFFSYAQADQAMCDQLAKHLSQLKRDGLIEGWSHQQIPAGSDRIQAKNQMLHSARIILLLISADYLASDACYQIEMQQALERHRQEQIRVIPVILRHCDWESSPFASLQCLPHSNKPITTWKNQDEAFLAITQGLRRIIEGLQLVQLLDKSPEELGFLDQGQPSFETGHSPESAAPSDSQPLIYPHEEVVCSVSWSPDGKSLVSVTRDGMVQIQNATMRALKPPYNDHRNNKILAHLATSVWKALWSPDGQLIASTGFSTDFNIEIHIWEANTGKRIATCLAPKAGPSFVDRTVGIARRLIDIDVYALAWSPDSAWIASACGSKQPVFLWQVKLDGSRTGPCRLSPYSQLGPQQNRWLPQSLAWAPNGRYIAVGGNDIEQRKKWTLDSTRTFQSIQLWDAHTRQLVRSFGASAWSNQVAWSPNSQYVASADGVPIEAPAKAKGLVTIWDAAKSLKVGKYQGSPDTIRTVAWSPDGSMLASGSNDHKVYVWTWDSHTRETKRLITYEGHTGRVLAVAWSPDGKRIASAGEDKTVQIWQAPAVEIAENSQDHMTTL